MVLHKKTRKIELNKVETRSKDTLYVKGNIEEWKVSIVLVYFSVGDTARNNEIKQEIEKIMEGNTVINYSRRLQRTCWLQRKTKGRQEWGNYTRLDGRVWNDNVE